jgi:hypothetical protein
MEVALIIVGIVAAFIFGRAYEAAEQEKAKKRQTATAAYRAMSDGEKLIHNIELLRPLDEAEFRRLLDIAPLDFAGPSDGITPIIATMRYIGQDYFSDSASRRWLILREIYRRLPKHRFIQSLNARDKQNWTALMYAAKNSDANSASLLIHLGADPNIENGAGDTAANIAGRWPTVVPVFAGREVTPAFRELLSRWEASN